MDRLLELRFGRGDIDLRATRDRPAGLEDRRSRADPPAAPIVRRTAQSQGGARSFEVVAVTGEPLRIERQDIDRSCGLRSNRPTPLEPAAVATCGPGLVPRRSSAAWGDDLRARALEATIEGRPMVPMSLLNQLRRELVARLDERGCRGANTHDRRRAGLADAPGADRSPNAIARCNGVCDAQPRRSSFRSSAGDTEQIEAAAACSASRRSTPIIRISSNTRMRSPQSAAARARRRSTSRPRASRSPARPTSSPIWPSKGPTGCWCGMRGACGFAASTAFRSWRISRSMRPIRLRSSFLKSRGAVRVTASYDLNVDQLLHLIDTTPPAWLEVVIHQQIPMFHMEHCVYCAFLSPGTDATNCGRPCDPHDVKLRDRVGMDHPLEGRRRLPQYALQRGAADGGRIPAALAKARGSFSADRVSR